jgi:hypothetical protein
MLGERTDTLPTLRLVSVTNGTWLRPDVQSPGGPPATLPAPYWASASRRGGLRRSATRVTCREAIPRRAHRSEAYLLTANGVAVAEPQAAALGAGAEAAQAAPTERMRGPILRLVAEVMAQMFKPASEAS